MSEDRDHVTMNFGEELDSPSTKTIQDPVAVFLFFRHPVAVFFHLCFRVLALVVYLFCGFFGQAGFVANFIIIVLLLSVDFWTVKNITGRLLAGLRWWNYVDSEGKSHWVFESRKARDAQAAVLGAESRIFWMGLVVSEVLWCIFAFIAIISLSFKWLMVSCVGATLNGANLYGYVRCKMGSVSNIKATATSFLGRQMIGSMFSNLTKDSTKQSSTLIS